MKKAIALVLTLVLMLSLVSVAVAAPYSSFGAYKHVFIIGVDGVGGAFQDCDTPNFDRIFARNSFTCDAVGEDITISAQNWGSILTGVAYDVHGFTNGSIEENGRDSTSPCGSVYRYAKNAYPNATFASFCNWEPISHGIIENDLGVEKEHRSTDLLVTDAFVNYFRRGNRPMITFVQLDSVDETAHSYGGGSTQYYEAIEKADEYIGRMYDAVCEVGLMKDGLFIVVTDHGEAIGGSHGGSSKEELTVTVAAAGKSVADGADIDGVRNRDVAAIVLYALGIEAPENMTAKVPEGLFDKLKPDYYPTPLKTMCSIAKLFYSLMSKSIGMLRNVFSR